jgi:hypothetical protein
MLSANLSFALRQLAKKPVLAATILLIMAVGTGVNAAIFSVVYAVLLKPLPYSQPDSLVFISATSGTGEKIPSHTPTSVIGARNSTALRQSPLTMFKISTWISMGRPSTLPAPSSLQIISKP